MSCHSHNRNDPSISQYKYSATITIEMFCQSHNSNILPLTLYKCPATLKIQTVCHSHSSNALQLSQYKCSSTPGTVHANCFRDFASFCFLNARGPKSPSFYLFWFIFQFFNCWGLAHFVCTNFWTEILLTQQKILSESLYKWSSTITIKCSATLTIQMSCHSHTTNVLPISQ